MRIAVVTKYDQQHQPLHAQVKALILQLAKSHDLFFAPQTPVALFEALGWDAEKAASRTSAVRLLATKVDVLVSIGGDGTMLGAAREVVSFGIPLIGVNQGRLGFITDIALDDQAYHKIESMLKGMRIEEERSLLYVQGQTALNDIAIQRAGSKMLELELSIDNRFAYRCRADGLLISTPTGSTAYNLASGGSIVAPCAKVFTLTPILPQSLANRPLIVEDSSILEVKIVANDAVVLADGLDIMRLSPGVSLTIKKNKDSSKFWHPEKDYNYLETLRTKLGWHRQD